MVNTWTTHKEYVDMTSGEQITEERANKYYTQKKEKPNYDGINKIRKYIIRCWPKQFEQLKFKFD